MSSGESQSQQDVHRHARKMVELSPLMQDMCNLYENRLLREYT